MLVPVLLQPGLLVLLLPAVRITGSCQTRLPAPAAHWRRATMSVADTSTAAPNVTEAASALQGQLRVQHTGQVRGLDERIFGFNRLLIGIVKGSIDAAYSYQDDGTLRQDVRRFYVLETVARVPYFAYLSVLHLRETLGERDLRETMRLHYAEADNELHHLLIMEALGGNATAFDRTLARTMAFFYYWYVVGVYVLSPEAAYHLSELIEDHAYDTYDDFLGRRGAEVRVNPNPNRNRNPNPNPNRHPNPNRNPNSNQLRALPVPAVAREYYETDDAFLFDLVSQSCRTHPTPSPSPNPNPNPNQVSKSCRTDPTPTPNPTPSPSPNPTPTPNPNQVSQSCRADRVGVADGCPRRPKLQSLYDVFECIRNDEKEVRRFAPQSTPRRPPSTTLPHTKPKPKPKPNPNPKPNPKPNPNPNRPLAPCAVAALGVSVHARAARRLRRRGRLAHTEHAARASREHTPRALRSRTRQQRYGCWGGGGHGSRLLVASIQCDGSPPRAAAALAGARRVWRVTVYSIHVQYTCTRAGMCVMSHVHVFM